MERNVDDSFCFVWHVWINQKCILWIDCFHTTNSLHKLYFMSDAQRLLSFFLRRCLPQSGPQILWLSSGWSWFVSAWQIHACLLVAWADASLVSPPRATSTWKLVLTRLGPPALTAGWWWHKSYLNMLHLLSFTFVFSVWIEIYFARFFPPF